MSRATAPWTLLLIFLAISLAAVGSFALVLFGGPVPDWSVADADGESLRAAGKRSYLRKRLQVSVTLSKGIDANTPLRDALEFLTDQYQIPLIIDSEAFQSIGINRVEEQPVQLPKLVGVSMATVLRLLLGQIRGDVHHATYSIQEDHILITTTLHASNAESWVPDSEMPAPMIDVHCVKKSLQAALCDVRDVSGVNVLVDARVTEKARKPITVSLAKVRVDTAVRLLADMSGLGMATMDNVLYVTTVENARELQAAQDARTVARGRSPAVGDPRREVPPAMMGGNPLVVPVPNSGIGPAPPPGLMAPPATAVPSASRAHGSDEAGRQVAIAAGLDWLSQHQAADGHWSLSAFHVDGNCNCTGGGGQHDVAGTAFALLPMLGAGESHKPAAKNMGFSGNVERGLKWLLVKQGADGSFSGNGYEHALATLVVCEAYQSSRDVMLKGPAQRAINCCVAWQHPAGGFRYSPRTPGDMSVTAWFTLALNSGRAAGLAVPNATWTGVSDFLDAIGNADSSGFGYIQPNPAPTMTAAGLLCRNMVREGWPEEGLAKGKLLLNKLAPSPNFKNLYFYYYATRVMNLEEDGRAAWNKQLQNLLIPQQDWADDPTRLHQKGSWSPAGDAWGGQLGRLGMTSFALMALQAAAPPKPDAKQPEENVK